MDREKAIRKLQKQKAEYLEEWVDYSGVAEAIDMAIEALSSEREWIPVSEKNPSQTGEYLVTVVCDNGATFTDKFGYTPTTDGGWYDPEAPNQTYTDWNKHILAWKPLPEPYKGGDTE